MPRRKKERGRPPKAKNLYPPRVDATAEEMARAMFRLPADHQREYPGTGAEGACVPLRGPSPRGALPGAAVP